MKNRRHMAIIEIIRQKPIQTQEEMAKELMERGYNVTQATVSRDIKELRLVKSTNANGVYCYSQGSSSQQDVTDRHIRIFIEAVLSIQSAGNLVVIKTMSGSANAACETIDSLKWPEIIGTIAGDNTLFLAVQDETVAKNLVIRFENLLK